MVSNSSPSSASERAVPATVRWRLLVLVTVVSVALDQATKWWAIQSLRPIGIKTVIRGYFDLRYSLNTGAAWSFLADADPTFRRWFFLSATILAMVLIGSMYHRARMDQRAYRWALALLYSGAIGNFIDRLRAGHVVDFISLHLRDKFQWATFNVADIAITAGLVLLAVDMIKNRKKSVPIPAGVAATPARPRPRRRKR
jgi:signal peptidase II